MTTRTARRAPRRPANDEPDEGYEPDPEETGEERTSRRSTSRPTRRSAPSRRDDADDTGDEPRGRRSRRDDDDGDGGETGEVRSGWGGWRQSRAEASDFADDFKVDYKEKYLITFLDDEPFASYTEHWIDEMPKGKKKSWICIGAKAGCPLCDALGEKPSAKALFNVAEWVDGEWLHKVWVVGSGVSSVIEEQTEDAQGPGLEGNYFKVYKTKSGKNGPTQYFCEEVKERDLGDKPFNAEPVSDDEWDALQADKKDKDYIKRPTKRTLQEIVEEYLND